MAVVYFTVYCWSDCFSYWQLSTHRVACALVRAEHIQFGWVSPTDQPEFCRFFGSFAGTTRLLAIRPSQQRYHLYKGKTDQASVDEYLAKIVANEIEVREAG